MEHFSRGLIGRPTIPGNATSFNLQRQKFVLYL